MRVGKATLDSDRFPSLTPDCPQVHLFEREIAEQYGVCPEGHPWFKPVRFHASYRPGHDAWGRKPGETPVIGVTDFYRVEGEEIHEVAVGPVHAGIIEPGHFRFQCHGEQVFHLEISLGYQHRGVERTLVGGPTKRTHPHDGGSRGRHLGRPCHRLLPGRGGPGRLSASRSVPRCCAASPWSWNGWPTTPATWGPWPATSGFLPTASYCGRIRGDFLNLTALLCGSRFGRGLVRPGGVGFDLDEDRKTAVPGAPGSGVSGRGQRRQPALGLGVGAGPVRGHGGGRREDCLALGMVGPAARACGVECDVRQDFPAGIFRFAQVPVSTWKTGDVFARAYVRWLEIQRSVAFIRSQLQAFPDGPVRADVGPLKPDHLSSSASWRAGAARSATWP